MKYTIAGPLVLQDVYIYILSRYTIYGELLNVIPVPYVPFIVIFLSIIGLI